MNFSQSIDEYIRDMRLSGRINSDTTEIAYRHALNAHAKDVQNRPPNATNREDVKRTLRRWPNANTQRVKRSILVSFYTWTVEEGIRPVNPALQTRRPKRKPTAVYRLTRDEAVRMMNAAQTVLEERAIMLGICAGLRRKELLGLQGRHFRRPGFIWVSSDIAKGGRERWVPIIGDLRRLVFHFQQLADDDYILHAQRWRNPGQNTKRIDLHKQPMSPQALYYLVKRVADRAGIHAPVHPHLMRHAYGDHIAKAAGLLAAQALLGHASVETTRGTYVGNLSLDALAAAVEGFSFKDPQGTPPASTPKNPVEATTGIEPVHRLSRLVPGLLAQIHDVVAVRVDLYVKHFTEVDACPSLS